MLESPRHKTNEVRHGRRLSVAAVAALTLVACTPPKGEADLNCSDSPGSTISRELDEDDFTLIVESPDGQRNNLRVVITGEEPGDFGATLNSEHFILNLSQIRENRETKHIARGTFAAIDFKSPQTAEGSEGHVGTLAIGCSAEAVEAAMSAIAAAGEQ